jgi:hypothetical protein
LFIGSTKELQDLLSKKNAKWFILR